MTDQEKIIYNILCSDEQPPEGQHWEGFVASKIAAALTYPPENAKLPLIRPEEFVKLIEGKENFWGIPVMRTEWPMPEQKVQFNFQEYGPPNWGESQVTKPEFVAEQKAMNEGLRKMVEQEPVAWGVDEGEGRCIDLHDVYFVPADAEHMAELKGNHAKVIPLYTAPPQREWVGLTDEEHTQIAIDCGCLSADWVFYGAAVERKLKEKNT